MPPPRSSISKGSNSRDEREKSLEFGMVEVFEFPVALGDNPHVSSGCPISLDWEAELRTIVKVDYYEKYGKRRRHDSEKLKLSVLDRAELLLGAGYSLDEIANATLQADATKRNRAESMKNQKWDGVNTIMESLSLRQFLQPRAYSPTNKSA